MENENSQRKKKKYHTHELDHHNQMISMEILITAFRSPSVMSLIAQINIQCEEQEQGYQL